MENQQTKIPTWFWIVAVILLIWNGLGVMNFIAQLTITEEALAELPEIEQEFRKNSPAWVYIAFGIAVFAGVAGSIALLLKKKIAKQLFIVSLIAIVAQFSYNFSVALSIGEYIGTVAGFAFATIGLGIYSIWLSISSTRKGWLT